ncbi:MAG: hypothetical protein MK081_13785 [Flavobacteriales bacterium]|nr:hypothetical protein [Flavobacteriales bacterium]
MKNTVGLFGSIYAILYALSLFLELGSLSACLVNCLHLGWVILVYLHYKAPAVIQESTLLDEDELDLDLVRP